MERRRECFDTIDVEAVIIRQIRSKDAPDGGKTGAPEREDESPAGRGGGRGVVRGEVERRNSESGSSESKVRPSKFFGCWSDAANGYVGPFK